MSEFGYENMFAEGGMSYPTFVNYVEGIYVGYRFYETAYAEAQAGNMEFDYDKIKDVLLFRYIFYRRQL